MPDGSRSPNRLDAPELDRVTALFREHYAFVWRVLRRCGVRPAELDDAVQETFVVLVRRLNEHDGRASVTTWLYAIAVRVASTLRRSTLREQSRRERAGAQMHGSTLFDPEAELSRVEAARMLDELLDEMDDRKRTVFVLAELEGVRAREISQILGVNVRTVHSRLRLARASFNAALDRRRARDENRIRHAHLLAQRLAQASDARPTPAQRNAAFAALATSLEQGSVPTLPGWTSLAISGSGSWVVPVAVSLAIGAASLGAIAIVTRTFGAADPPAPARAAAEQRRVSSPIDPPIAVSTPALAEAASHPTPDPSITHPARARIDRAPALASASVSSTLAAETTLLEAARRALQSGDAAAALRALDDHATRFGDGVLASEIRSTRINALCQAGRRADAYALADALAPGSTTSRWHAIADANCRD